MRARPVGLNTPTRAAGLSGLGTTESRVVMIMVWLGHATVVMRGGGGGREVVALALLLAAVWLVTSSVHEPVPRRLAVAVVALAGVATFICFAPATDDHFVMLGLVAYLFAFVIIRGRVTIAITSYLATVAVVYALTERTGRAEEMTALVVATFPQVLWGPGALLLALGWRALLIRGARRLEEIEVAQSASAVAETESRERIRAWEEHLSQLSGDVGALLERASSGGLDSGDSELAARLEVGLRDRLRAPRLTQQPLLAATEAARDRGAVVVLLDDGERDRPLTDEQVEVLLGQLSASAPGDRLTIRLNPPGRPVSGTIMREVGDRAVRVELA